MKKANKQRFGKMMCCLFSVAILATGCTYQRSHSLKPVGMPEEVYIRTPLGKYYTPSIAVLPFASDGYAWQVGQKASRLLCSEMLKQGVGADMVSGQTEAAMGSDALARFAREHRYDYIVTGEILHFLNGGTSTRSRVEEEIRIYSVTGRQLQMAGYAKAVESAPPLSDADFILVSGRGALAPSAETLLERNSRKFALLLADMLSRNGTTH